MTGPTLVRIINLKILSLGNKTSNYLNLSLFFSREKGRKPKKLNASEKSTNIKRWPVLDGMSWTGLVIHYCFVWYHGMCCNFVKKIKTIL